MDNSERVFLKMGMMEVRSGVCASLITYNL